jgi:hypothetical protein
MSDTGVLNTLPPITIDIILNRCSKNRAIRKEATGMFARNLYIFRNV